MTGQIDAYIESRAYQRDLKATHLVWGRPQVFGMAGIFMFLSYLSIPLLTAVQPADGLSRIYTMKMGLEGEREKRFLLRLLGLSQERDWEGGLLNPRVRAMIAHLGRSHLKFSGMSRDYMRYFGGITAISIVRVHASSGIAVQPDVLAGYWMYMRHALSLLDIPLDSPDNVERSCEEFISTYTAVSDIGRMLFGALLEVYPDYVNKTLPVLFPATLSVVTTMLEEYHVRFP